MRRVTAALILTLFGLIGSATGAAAEPTPATTGCQTVATKFLNPETPGHEGIATSVEHNQGEGPCGFGDPPTGP